MSLSMFGWARTQQLSLLGTTIALHSLPTAMSAPGGMPFWHYRQKWSQILCVPAYAQQVPRNFLLD